MEAGQRVQQELIMWDVVGQVRILDVITNLIGHCWRVIIRKVACSGFKKILQPLAENALVGEVREEAGRPVRRLLQMGAEQVEINGYIWDIV